jgi:hypothetical protein
VVITYKGDKYELELSYNRDGSAYIQTAFNITKNAVLTDAEMDMLQDNIDLSEAEFGRLLTTADFMISE